VNCRDVIREVSSYLDGELELETISELQLHLDRCQDCRIIVDTVRKTIDIYCKAEPAPLPEDMRARLHEAMVKRLGRRRT